MNMYDNFYLDIDKCVFDAKSALMPMCNFHAFGPHTGATCMCEQPHASGQTNFVCVWCSCGRGQALHPLKPQSITSTCPPLAQGQAHDTPQWTPQPWVHTHSGMSVTAMMETTRITSACAGIVAGHQAMPLAAQGLLAACLHPGGSLYLPCSFFLGPCLLVWALAGRPSPVAHCPQGCQHSPSSNLHHTPVHRVAELASTRRTVL